MKATLIPDKLTQMSKEDAIVAFYQAYCQVVGDEPKDKALAILVAQSCLETGWWKSIHNFNFGNIKAGSTYEGYYCQYRCNEIINGHIEWFDPPHPQTNFRAYLSAGAGATEHMAFLSKRAHYAKAWAAALSGDPTAYVKELKAAGYFTASLDPYLQAVVSLVNTFLPVIEKKPWPPVCDAAHPCNVDDSTANSPTSDADLSNLLQTIQSLQIPLEVDWDAIRKERDQAVEDEMEKDEG